MQRALAALASETVEVEHNVRLPRMGDLDHVIRAGDRVVLIETKAEGPTDDHLTQSRWQAEHAGRVLYDGRDIECVVVHPNSDEPVTYDRISNVWRCGLPSLEGLVKDLLGM